MEHQTDSENCSIMGLMWWTTLAVAVLAVPCFAIVVSYIFPFRGIGGLITFVLACWLCTYLGMRLMSNPKMSEKIGSGKN
jgi:hypothetical protein